MTKIKHAVAASLTLLLLASAGSAYAATAHNSQTGAGTANVYDTAAAAQKKQIR